MGRPITPGGDFDGGSTTPSFGGPTVFSLTSRGSKSTILIPPFGTSLPSLVSGWGTSELCWVLPSDCLRSNQCRCSIRSPSDTPSESLPYTSERKATFSSSGTVWFGDHVVIIHQSAPSSGPNALIRFLACFAAFFWSFRP